MARGLVTTTSLNRSEQSYFARARATTNLTASWLYQVCFYGGLPDETMYFEVVLQGNVNLTVCWMMF
jgi:hypothetical protein